MKRKDGLPPYWHMSAEHSIHTNREWIRCLLHLAALNDIGAIRAGSRKDDSTIIEQLLSEIIRCFLHEITPHQLA